MTFNTIKHVSSALYALLAASQFPSDITMLDGAMLLSSDGASTLMTDYDVLSERGCFLDQSCRFELYALIYKSEHVYIMRCTFFSDYVCTYSDALACNDAESVVNYLFTDSESAFAAFLSLASDGMHTSDE